MNVTGTLSAIANVYWNAEITPQVLHAWEDEQELTEFGACGIAILLTLELTEYTVIRRARKGSGIDYWLGHTDAEHAFQDAARLEVSGILRGDSSDIRSRVEKKKKQTEQSDGKLPAYIIVVEFSKPESYLVKK